MKVTCEDVAELGMEVVAKRKELREAAAHWDRLREDLEEDLGSCRAQNDYLTIALEEARHGMAKAQDGAARLERQLEAARKEQEADKRQRQKMYQELERHVLNWIAVGDVFELTCERAAFMDVAGEAVPVVLPVGHQVSVVELPGLAYQVKCEGWHPADPLNNPPARLTAPLGDLRLVKKWREGDDR